MAGNSRPSFQDPPQHFWASSCLALSPVSPLLTIPELPWDSCEFFFFYPHLSVSCLVFSNYIHWSIIQAGSSFWRDLATSSIVLGYHLGFRNGWELSGDSWANAAISFWSLSARVFCSVSFQLQPYPGKLFSSLMILSQVLPTVIWQSAGEREDREKVIWWYI